MEQTKTDTSSNPVEQPIEEDVSVPSKENSGSEEKIEKAEEIQPKIDEGPALENLFDDDIDMENATLDPETNRLLAAYDDPWADLNEPQVMSNYYRRLFPWKQLFLWLNQDHVPNYAFTHREFAVTLRNEAYLRYNSYASHIELQKDIVRLNPTRFEIGPAYTAQPKDRKLVSKAAFKPILRELVFDIDLTDYDDIRSCCSEARICLKCWKFITIAVQVLDLSLREDFGFQHLLWVYSGRRGIHCWVSDEEALKLTDEQRKGIVNFLDILRGGGSRHGLKVSLMHPIHPSLERSYNILKVYFRDIAFVEQDAFKDPEKLATVLQALSESEQLKHISEKLTAAKEMSSSAKWDQIHQVVGKEILTIDKKANSSFSDQRRSQRLKEALINIQLHYTYPRIDLEVSKHMNHLLKSPFCVHPGTGKVCVPIDPTQIHAFDPEKVPDVRDLLRELDKVGRNQPGEGLQQSIRPNWDQTALKPYIEIFEKHVNKIVKEKLKSKKQAHMSDKAQSMEF